MRDYSVSSSIKPVTITSSGPSFRVHRKVETLVPSTILDTYIAITKQIWDAIFSIYIIIEFYNEKFSNYIKVLFFAELHN